MHQIGEIAANFDCLTKAAWMVRPSGFQTLVLRIKPGGIAKSIKVK
jgi:hypothetical protein